MMNLALIHPGNTNSQIPLLRKDSVFHFYPLFEMIDP
jgi:hypothetical protein